jgi:hypothetical protein
METLQATGPLPGFEVVEPDSILPEIVDVGEYREDAGYRSRLRTQNHWLVLYVVEGTSQIGLVGGPEIWLKPGSVACLRPNLGYWAVTKPAGGALQPRDRLLDPQIPDENQAPICGDFA